MKKVLEFTAEGVQVTIYEGGVVVVMGAKRFYGTTTAPEDASTLWPHVLANEERHAIEHRSPLKGLEN